MGNSSITRLITPCCWRNAFRAPEGALPHQGRFLLAAAPLTCSDCSLP